MKINVHAGHNPDGMIACGAIGLIKESTEARLVKNLVIQKLREAGHTVYDCTIDDGKSAKDILQRIVSKCNQHSVDLDISIHFNAGRNDQTGDGSIGGTEIFVYNTNGTSYTYASNILNSIVALGFTNRGIKVNQDLYVLANTKSQALLIECCFVDDADDVKLYNYEKMALAIVKGITGKDIVHEETTKTDFNEAKDFLMKLGITDGSRPTDPVKRNEVWAMLYRTINKYNLK